MSLNDLSDQPEILQSLPADKYGKAAFVELTYTPRKLKDNLLYIEAVTLKKEQEKSNKLRQITAQNDLLQDRVDQLKREKQCIQDSLGQQIAMYKKFLAELEQKYEIKIKNMQNQFKKQMRIVILEQEEASKVLQAEKQLYQRQIQNLKRRNQELEARLGETTKSLHQINAEREKLHLSQKEITFQLQEAKQLKKIQDGNTKKQLQNLKQRMFQAEENWKTKLHSTLVEKQKQMDSIKRQSLQDLSKLEQKASSQNLLKNNEMQQLTKTFNSEVERLNAKLSQRDEAIAGLNKNISEQKQKLLELTRVYDRQINTLIHEKNRLAGENARLLSHPVNFGLNIQIDKLKQLLRQSYDELESCKEQLVDMDRERSKILLQISDLNRENELLQRSRRW